VVWYGWTFLINETTYRNNKKGGALWHKQHCSRKHGQIIYKLSAELSVGLENNHCRIVILVNNQYVRTKNEKLTIGEYMYALIGRREKKRNKSASTSVTHHF
jgi:hypothetical protein